MRTRTITLPWDERWTHHCPSCGRILQEWHPAEGWGHCGECGFSFEMSDPAGHLGMS